MINTQKFLKSENSGSFFERANRKLISVNSMLRGSLTQRKARQRIKAPRLKCNKNLRKNHIMRF